MKKITILSITLIISVMFYPTHILAEPSGRGIPHLFTGILDEIKSIDMKIDGLDSDNDNPLLNDILGEIQGLRTDVSNIGTINGSSKSEGLIVDPGNGSVHDLVSITGSGTFVAARMTKQGGTNNITSVQLIIDGKTIVSRTFAALNNWGMTQNNPFGIVLLHGNGVDAVTIGFSQPIKFENSLVLRTTVGETGVVQMIGTVIYGQ